MTQPELINIDWSLFQADGNWHPIGHGIEIMAHPHMMVGTFYIRAADSEPPAPGKAAQGERLTVQRDQDHDERDKRDEH